MEFDKSVISCKNFIQYQGIMPYLVLTENSFNNIDYINEFEQLNQKLINYKTDLPYVVRAYQLKKN